MSERYTATKAIATGWRSTLRDGNHGGKRIERNGSKKNQQKQVFNDGVVLNIAPLHELVSWKEAKKYWDELLDGKYEWSSIGKQLREKGLVA